MFLKLVKHEFKAINRFLIPTHLILLVLAIVGRLIMIPLSMSILGNATDAYPISRFSEGPLYGGILLTYFLVYFMAIIAIPTLNYIFLGVRFYKSMFTEEGYMSFSLPVTPVEHLMSKVLTAVVYVVVGILTMFLSFAILLSYPEIFRAIFSEVGLAQIKEAFEVLLDGNILSVIGMILSLVVSTFTSIFALYACICLGQLHHKARGLMSIVYYGLFYIIYSMINGIGTTLISYAIVGRSYIVAPSYFFSYNIWFTVIMGLIIAVSGFFICRYVMTKRLNLQ